MDGSARRIPEIAAEQRSAIAAVVSRSGETDAYLFAGARRWRMRSEWVLRGAMVAATAVLVLFVLLRDESTARDGWRDCTAPRLQATAKRSPTTERVPLNLENFATLDGVSLLDVGDRILVASVTGKVVDVGSGETILDISDEVRVGSEQGAPRRCPVP